MPELKGSREGWCPTPLSETCLLRAARILGLSAFCLLQPTIAHSQDFHGYPCTEDCSGHEAGYNWAEENDIHDPDDCSGNSQSFIEGCQAYADENPDTDSSDDQNSSSTDTDSDDSSY